MTETRV